MSKLCEHCGNEFEAKRKDKRFCDTSCRNAAWTQENRRPKSVATIHNASLSPEIIEAVGQLQAIVATMQSAPPPIPYDPTAEIADETRRSVDLQAEMLAEMKGISAKLDKLLTSPRAVAPHQYPPSTTLPAPEILDDGPELEVKDRAIGKDFNPGWTLAIKMASLGKDYRCLTAEMVEYGRRKGMIEPESGGLKRIQGADIELPEPDFDDVEFDLEE